MKKYRDFVHSLIGHTYRSPFVKTQNSFILGSEEFMDEIKDRFLRVSRNDRELPILRTIMDRPNMETIERAVDSELKLDAKLARQIKLFLCHRHSGLKLREIGDRFNVSESAVTQASYRIKIRLPNDKDLEKLVLKIVKRLNLSNV